MMKNFFRLTLAVALLVIGANTAYAQKFGRVDFTSIVLSLPEYKEAEANLETYGKDLQNQLEEFYVELNKKSAEYEKNLSTYNDTVRQMKESELQQLQQNFTQFQQTAQQAMQQKNDELMAPIVEKVENAIKKVSSAGGYLVVYNIANGQAASANLAYFDENALTDITAAVKKELGITEEAAK